MNDKMKKIICLENNQAIDEKTHGFLEDIVRHTKIINDCVIYDDEGINEENIDFEQILKFAGDYSGYEVGCNEFKLKKSDIKTNQFQKLAIDMNNLLNNKYKNRKFVIYVSVKYKYIEIRFHTYKKTEGFWLCNDLDKYSNPILCLT